MKPSRVLALSSLLACAAVGVFLVYASPGAPAVLAAEECKHVELRKPGLSVVVITKPFAGEQADPNNWIKNQEAATTEARARAAKMLRQKCNRFAFDRCRPNGCWHRASARGVTNISTGVFNPVKCPKLKTTVLSCMRIEITGDCSGVKICEWGRAP